MKWFRLYSEMRHDPKVQRLEPSLFKMWINLLCVANDQDKRGLLPPLGDLVIELRSNRKIIETRLAELAKIGLLDKTDDGLAPHNWQSRQYRSDNVTERVKRFRNVSETANETGLKRPQITDNRSQITETDKQPPNPLARGKVQPKASPELLQVSECWIKLGLGPISQKATTRMKALIAAHGTPIIIEHLNKASAQNVKGIMAWLEVVIPQARREAAQNGHSTAGVPQEEWSIL